MDLSSTLHNPVGVVGAGRFGVAVANLLAKNSDVILYARNPDTVVQIQAEGVAAKQKLARNITVTNDLATLATQCDVILPIVPSHAFRGVIRQLSPFLKPYHILIHGTKGLDVCWPQAIKNPRATLPHLSRNDIKTMSEVIRAESVVVKIGCLAGPNLAAELAQEQPAATVVASQFEEVITQGQRLLKNDRFQVYSSADLIGVELCGALKNIIAIGAGCLGGIGYGDNAKALLISRGILEMMYIGQAMGTSIQPFIGLAGIGDLVATCASPTSRNYTVGYQLAQGKTFDHIMETMDEIAEGVYTIKIVKHLINDYAMRAPITEMMHRVVFDGVAAKEAIQQLMKYPFKVDVDLVLK